jgi:hypothetical protein
MSLHKFADMVAKQGRGEDSLLIHMTPDEVQRLQQFAEANGRSLTINPETGLPEAGMLSDLFKAVAPIALGAFLGPGAFGITGLGLSAGTAGLVTGGLTTLATGSLSRGLMAGLGAYGGAGLAEGLATAGTGAGLSEALAGSATGTGPQVFGDVAAAQGSSGQAFNEFLKSSANPATMSGAEAASAGFKAAASDPMAFAKQNFGSIAAAAAPIMAGQMVPTTTKMPENTNPAYIRQKLYDPYTQTYKSLAPVKASEWGNRSFSDAYTNPQTGGIATLDQRAPTPMASGGIVALAAGGPPTMLSDEELFKQTGSWEAAAAARDAQNNALNQYNWSQQAAPNAGSLVNDKQIADYFKTSGLTDAQIAQDMQTYKVSAADIARATGSQGQEADYNTRFVKAVALPGTDTTEFMNAASAVGLKDQALANALQNSGLSAAAQYALTHQHIGSDLNTAETQGGLEGLSNNINYALAQNKLTGDAGKIAALTEMNKYGISEDDVFRATGKTLAELFPTKKITPPPLICGPGFELNAAGTACVPVKGTATTDTGTGTGTSTVTTTQSCPSGYHWDPVANACVLNTSATQNTTEVVTTPTSLVTAPATTLPVGVSGTTGPSIEGGGATVNPNGTITTSPVIPGIPVGGFTGMEQVRDAYTAGGGSLGYIPKAPKTMAEFEQMYNRQTGDSLAAYNYLMGRGANPVQSVAASSTSGIMRPYWSGGMKYKPKYLSLGKDGSIVSSSTSGTPADVKAADLTTAKTIEVVDSSGYNTQTYTAVLQPDGTYLAGNGKRYDVTGKELAAGGGMMGYAMGGGLGSLGSYSDGGRLLKGPGDGVSDSIPATIGEKQQPARLADGEFVVPARIVSELGNGSTEAGARKLYAMMDRVQKARGKTTGKNKVAANTRADKHLPA